MTPKPTETWRERFDEKFYEFYNGKDYQGYIKIHKATMDFIQSTLDQQLDEIERRLPKKKTQPKGDMLIVLV